MSEGEFVNMRPTRPHKTGPADIDESTDTWDTIDWLLKHMPNHNGQGGFVGHLLSRFLHADGHDRCPPGAEGRLAQAPVTDWFTRRRLAPSTELRAAPRLQFFIAFSAFHARSRPKKSRSRSITSTPTATSSSSTWGRWPTPTSGTLKTMSLSGTKSCGTGLRRFLASARRSPASEERPAGGDDRGWLVRRRRPVRRARDLQARRGRAAEARRTCW